MQRSGVVKVSLDVMTRGTACEIGVRRDERWSRRTIGGTSGGGQGQRAFGRKQKYARIWEGTTSQARSLLWGGGGGSLALTAASPPLRCL